MNKQQVSLEDIEQLRKRFKISYQEARDVLVLNHGDLVEAVVHMEQMREEKKHQSYKDSARKGTSFLEKIKGWFRIGNQTKIHIQHEQSTVACIPVNYIILTALISIHLLFITIVLVFVTGCKVSVKKSQGDTVNLDEALIEISGNIRKHVEHGVEYVHDKVTPSPEGKDNLASNSQGKVKVQESDFDNPNAYESAPLNQAKPTNGKITIQKKQDGQEAQNLNNNSDLDGQTNKEIPDATDKSDGMESYTAR